MLTTGDPRSRSRLAPGARRVLLNLALAVASGFASGPASGAARGSREAARPIVPAAPPAGQRVASLADQARDPFGAARTSVRPRVWMLLDTSTSMDELLGNGTRFGAAREVIRWAADNLESDVGEPLVHWRLAAFRPFDFDISGTPPGEVCEDPTLGAGLPAGAEPGIPRSGVRCSGLRIVSNPSGCDAEAARTALVRELPAYVNSNRTPNGIALYELAAHIANTATDDLAPGQKNIIVLVTDGRDSCECGFRPWLDFNEGPAGRGSADTVRLRTGALTAEETVLTAPEFQAIAAWNAGLKARAAYLALNRGDPDAGLGDIHVVGLAMSEADARGFTNHLAWMASGNRHPAIHVDRLETLRTALDQVLGAVTLPAGEVRLAAPRLATIKELVASSPNPAFSGSDPSLSGTALVAPPGGGKRLDEVLRLRASYRDNVLLSSGADLGRLRGTLRALPTSSAGGGGLAETPVWEAGARLAERHPDDRLVLFNRPGSAELRPFRVGEVTPEDLGVGAGYLSALDGVGARTDHDAVQIVVRLVRGEELSVHPDTGNIYGPGGALHFEGGKGTWKLREGLASPAVVTEPPRHPGQVRRQRDAYRGFFDRRRNRRTMVYFPTSGGMLHAFAGDSGEEVFAYIPGDVLGPAPLEREPPQRPLLRDLALANVRGAAGLARGLVNRFTLAGSPVARDVFLPDSGEWRTLLAFGRAYGGSFVTVLDVTGVGDGWRGGHAAPRPPPGAPGLPRLLFNRGRGAANAGELDALGETPEPLLVEAPAASGSEWVVVLPAGMNSAEIGVGESLYVLSPADGRVRFRYRAPAASGATIQRNSLPSPAVGWRPSWAANGATDLVTRVYAADVQGQIHRLDLTNPGAWQAEVAHRMGGDHPILASPVVFPFPGRAEPHLLVVTGGDRRVEDGPSAVVLLRDEGTHFEEVWRRTLAAGEFPQGKPVVLTDGAGVDVVIATRSRDRQALSCDVVRTADGVARLRAFNGLSGADAPGVVGRETATLSFGHGRIRGISLSRAGNMALSVSSAAGNVVDTVIGDFKFQVREGALEDVTIFVEGFRQSPFWRR